MTPNEIRLVRSTFEMIAPTAEQAATLFYEKLFEMDPSLRRMFRGDMTEQARKLMHVIGTAVHGLDHAQEITPVLHDLGRRHAGYGVQDRHYDTVAAALLWTLERGLGPAFTPQARSAWVAAYGFLTKAMKAGAMTQKSTLAIG
jgi:hemoglobin-like flavoprotein